MEKRLLPEHMTSTRTLSVGTISKWQRRSTNVAIDIKGHRTAEAQLYMTGAVDDGESIYSVTGLYGRRHGFASMWSRLESS
mmetsp:Transcript_10035/g.28126  ORF Transcript_10035/g.28126 Transcript_10035/m.28126 type:complete len:81 (+) Transcript_10035:52-294(+)